MSGGFSNHSDTAVTPGRKTHFRFDVDELVCRQPAWSIDREEEQIQPVYDQSTLTSDNVEFIPDMGWRPQAIHSISSNIHENGAPVDSLTVPGGYGTFSAWAKSTAGSPTYDGSVTASGDVFYNRNLAAGDTVGSDTYNLSSDQGSETGPALGANAPMNRVGVGASTVMQEKIYSWEARGNPKSSPDHVNGCYFKGPVGWPLNADGYTSTGYFYIDFKGDGRFEVLVKLWNGSAPKWVSIKKGRYCLPDQVHNVVHRVQITPVIGGNLGISGGYILFRFTSAGKPISDPPKSGYQAILSQQASTTDDIGSFHAKIVLPGVAETVADSHYAFRVDARQDLDVAFQVATVTYKTSAHLFDQLFQLPFLPDSSGGAIPFNIIYWGKIPAGCDIQASVYCITPGTVSDPTPVVTLLGTGHSGFTCNPVDGQRYYAVRFTWSGPGSTYAYLQGYRVFRNGQVVVNSPGEFEPAFQPTAPLTLRSSYATGHLSITGAESDPSTSSASFEFDDLNGDLAKLQQRGDFPCCIETEIQGHIGVRVKWHRGYVRLPESAQIGNHHSGYLTGGLELGSEQDFNYKHRFKGHVTATGAWQRLKEALMPVRFNFAIGGVLSDGTPVLPKVTDAFKQLFVFAGLDASQYVVPDYDTQLFPSDDGDGLVLEPQASIWDVLQRWAKDYFGAYWHFEPNAGSCGAWLFLEQKSTFKYKASFVTTAPAAGKVFTLAAYPDVTIGSDTMPQIPIIKGHITWQPKPPEGNYVVSFGASEGGGGDTAGLISVTAFNMGSFNFSGFPGAASPDPTNPDYLSRPVPIWQYLPAYASSKPDDWTSPIFFATRRTYDVACRGRLTKTILAPAVAIYDTDEGYWRGLRFYDEVYVDGDKCLIHHADIEYSKDDYQLCSYVVEKLIDGAPAQLSGGGAITNTRRAMAKVSLHWLGEPIWYPRQLAIEKRSWGDSAHVQVLPAIRTSKLQNDDGSFVWMLGYDPLGH